jgi:hypothetical protein
MVNIRTGKKSNKQEGKVKIGKGYQQNNKELRESTLMCAQRVLNDF